MTKILVMGDTIIDEDIFALASGLSLESPTIKGSFVKRSLVLGGAANVVTHLSKLIEHVDFFSSVNKTGEDLIKKAGVRLFNFPNSSANTKSRYWVKKGDSTYKVLQINDTAVLKKRNQVFNFFKSQINLNDYDKVIVSDYGLGLISDNLTKYVADHSLFSLGASQISDNKSNYKWFSNFDFVVCNEKEYRFAKICPNVCVTLGSGGCRIEDQTYPTEKIEGDSFIGAGDAFLAAFAVTEDPQKSNVYVKDVLEKQIEQRAD